MVTALVGTPYLPRVRGGILFLEDVNEPAYRIERMLHQLLHAGVLGRCRAVILGDFAPVPVQATDNGFDLAAAVAHLRSRIDVPLLTGLPFGYVPRKLTLPVGARARLRARGARGTVLRRLSAPAAVAAFVAPRRAAAPAVQAHRRQKGDACLSSRPMAGPLIRFGVDDEQYVQRQASILAGVIASVQQQVPRSILGSFVGSVALLVVYWHAHDARLLAAWFVAMGIVRACFRLPT